MHIMHTMKMKIRVRPHLSIFSPEHCEGVGGRLNRMSRAQLFSETDENIQYSAKIPTIQ